MKKLGMILSMLLLPGIAFAVISASQEFQLNRMNSVAQSTQLGTLLAKTKNVVVGKYSFAVQGGAVGNINLLRDLTDTHSTVVLPDNAVIRNVYVDVLTQPTSSSAASVSVGAVSDGDLVASTAKGSFTGILDGVPANTAVTTIKLAADKTVYAKVITTALTAGKFNVYIEYALGD